MLELQTKYEKEVAKINRNSSNIFILSIFYRKWYHLKYHCKTGLIYKFGHDPRVWIEEEVANHKSLYDLIYDRSFKGKVYLHKIPANIKRHDRKQLSYDIEHCLIGRKYKSFSTKVLEIVETAIGREVIEGKKKEIDSYKLFKLLKGGHKVYRIGK